MQRHKHQAPALGDDACCAQQVLLTKFVKSSPAQPQAKANWPARAACCGNNPSRTWRAVFSSVCNHLTIFQLESNHLQGSPSQPGQDLAEQALSATPCLYMVIGSTTWSGKDEITAPTKNRRHLPLCRRAYRDQPWQEWNGFLHFMSSCKHITEIAVGTDQLTTQSRV